MSHSEPKSKSSSIRFKGVCLNELKAVPTPLYKYIGYIVINLFEPDYLGLSMRCLQVATTPHTETVDLKNIVN